MNYLRLARVGPAISDDLGNSMSHYNFFLYKVMVLLADYKVAPIEEFVDSSGLDRAKSRGESSQVFQCQIAEDSRRNIYF